MAEMKQIVNPSKKQLTEILIECGMIKERLEHTRLIDLLWYPNSRGIEIVIDRDFYVREFLAMDIPKDALDCVEDKYLMNYHHWLDDHDKEYVKRRIMEQYESEVAYREEHERMWSLFREIGVDSKCIEKAHNSLDRIDITRVKDVWERRGCPRDAFSVEEIIYMVIGMYG
jgi:hypothetical protein